MLYIEKPPGPCLFPYTTLFRSLGRFWHSVYQSQQVTLWGVWVGVLAGVLAAALVGGVDTQPADRKSTRLNSSHVETSYAVFCSKKKNMQSIEPDENLSPLFKNV